MALITTIEELKKKLPVAYSNIASKMPTFEMAEERYLLDILGQDLYAELNEAVAAEELSAAQALLLDRCQAVIAPFAYVLNLPFLQTQLTDNGLQRKEPENSRGAFRWEFNAVVDALNDLGYTAQEKLILFLKANATDFPAWANSPYNDIENFSLIRDGGDIRNVLGLQQPHRCFLMLRPIFSSVYQLYLEGAIGKEFYQALSARIVAGITTAQDKELLASLRMAAARLCMKHAAQELSIKFGVQGGFTVVDASQARDSGKEGEVDPGDSRMMVFARDMEQTGKALLDKSIAYLNANASETVFQEYFTSALYVNPNLKKELPYDNSNRKGVFVM